MSVNYQLYIIDHHTLEDAWSNTGDGDKVVEFSKPIPDELYSGNLSDHVWHGETYKHISPYLPEDLRSPIEDYISRISSFGQLDVPCIFDFKDESANGDNPLFFMILNSITQSKYTRIYEECTWEKLEPSYDQYYKKNDPAENFKYFMKSANEMYSVLKYALSNKELTIIGQMG